MAEDEAGVEDIGPAMVIEEMQFHIFVPTNVFIVVLS